MFLPNRTGLLSNAVGRNASGEPIFGKPKKTPCAFVHLKLAHQKTSVRADSSASRGSARETVSETIILFPVYANVNIGDRFQHGSSTFRINSCEERYSVTGDLDHLETTAEVWAP